MSNLFEQGKRFLAEDRFSEAAECFTEALRQTTDPAEVLRERALAFLYDAEYEKAMSDADQAVARTPNDAENYFVRISVRTTMDEAAIVDEDLETLRRLAPNDPDYFVTLATNRLVHSDLPGAMEAAERALQLDPENFFALYDRGVCHFWNGRDQEANDDFRNVRKLIERLPPPLDPRCLALYGGTLHFLQETEAALATVDTGIRRFPKLPQFYLWRSAIQIDNRSWDEVREPLARAEELMNRDSLWESSLFLGRASLYSRDGKHELAEQQLDAVLTRLPNNLVALDEKISAAQSRFIAGELEIRELRPYLDLSNRLCSMRPKYYRYYLQRHWLHHTLGNRDEAETDLNVTLTLVPDRAGDLHHVAAWLIDTCHIDEAMDLLDRVLTLEPNNVEALRDRGNQRLWMGMPDLAFEDLDRAVQLKGDDADLLEGRATALTDLGVNEFFDISYGRALADLDRAVELQPDNAVLWWRRGVVRYRLALKRFWTRRRHGRDSLNDYSEAIRLNPEDANSWYCRALTHQLLKDFDAAVADCDEAIRLNPEFVEAIQVRADCRRKLGDDPGADKDEFALARIGSTKRRQRAGDEGGTPP